MQELMSRHKAYALSPRDCLKTTLFQKWQKMVAPPGKTKRCTTGNFSIHTLSNIRIPDKYVDLSSPVDKFVTNFIQKLLQHLKHL